MDNYKRGYTYSKFKWRVFYTLVKLLKVQAELDTLLARESEFSRYRGQWQSFDRILNLINSYETNKVYKKEIYKDIMEMRPK